MTVISKSKILPWADVFPQIEEIVSNQTDTPFCVSIPYGLQLQKHLWNPERLRVVRHVKSGTGHSFISHHGVGKNNEINIWNFSKEKQPGNLAAGIQSVSTDLMFLHILFSQRRWVYVTYCNDMSMRVFSAKFHLVSTTSVKKTVLSLAYNEIRDEIITGIAGGIMTWKFSVAGQQDPLIPGQLISCSFEPFDWVMSLTIDNRSQQILAISDVRISMIYLHSNQERCFFQKKCDFSFTTCAFYNPASYFITGDKNGSIRAWSTSVNSFPMVTQFLGHTSEITKLLVHPEEPLLVSSSLDKTIRIWNFDTCAQTFKLKTGEEVISMSLLSDDLLYYHSDHHIKIWSLNLFHSLFTALSSKIRICIRVKSPGYPCRVLVLAEDGGVRLVSPVRGYVLTTLLPITNMTTDVMDVAHDPRQEKIYLALGTREVLVFASDTNPCCAHQLWVPDSPDEGVCSLALVNAEFALHENELPLQSGLLFAGHYDGQISLISGKDIYMRENIQAHQGQVTFLRVSASCSESSDSLASRDHLISCGTDCTVRIWRLIHSERNQVSILQVALVKLLRAPRDLAMAGNTLCMAMADNNVIMCRVQADRKSNTNSFDTVKNSHEFLMHSKDEGHSAVINGLSCCSTLGLFATSSEDQSVKIWNTDNQLVREMCFDESLCGVCFANSRGDILVGFQSHISLVTILNYLPLSYLKILSRKSIENDPFEDHVQFNDLLKSWYDPQRVPRMPLKADKRRPLELTEIKKPKKRKKKEPEIEKAKQEDGEGQDLFQKRRQSRKLSTQIHAMMALRRLSKNSSKKSLAKMVNGILEKQDESAKMEDSQNWQTPLPLPDEKETPKKYWPCAPDGYIPNSVIRKFIKPKPFPDHERLISRHKRHVTSNAKVKEEEDEETDEDLRITALKEEFKRDEDERGKAKRWRVSKRNESKLGRCLPSRPQAGTSTSKEPLANVEEDHGEEEMEEEELDEEEQEQEQKEGEEMEKVEEEEEVAEQEESNKSSPESTSESSTMCSPMEIQESPELFFEESDEEETDIDVFRSPFSDTDSVDSVMRLEIKPNTNLLSRIKGKDWYPTLQKKTLPTVDTVLDDMVSALKTENCGEYIKDICESFKNIEREFGIPGEKMNEIQKQFIRMTSSENPSTRWAAVWALGRLNVHRNDAYLSLVRRLVDDDKDTRKQATKVLKDLTGVDTKEGLCRLLINTGVVNTYLRCNDNAVLLELAERLRRKYGQKANVTVVEEDDEEVSPPSDLRNTDLRNTLKRKPFKANFKQPITMKKRPREVPVEFRKHSIFERPPSLADTDKFKAILTESHLGCKLLQNMEPSRRGTIHSQTLIRAKDVKDSLEVGGASVSSPELDQELRRNGDKIQRATTSRRFSHRETLYRITSMIPEYRLTPITVSITSRSSVSSSAVWTPTDLGKPCKSTTPEEENVKASKKSQEKIRSSVTPESNMQVNHKAQSTTPSQSLSHKTQSVHTTPSRAMSQHTTSPEPRMEPKDGSSYKRQTSIYREGHEQHFTLGEILSIMGQTAGINQASAKLLLLKTKRTKPTIEKQISVDDDEIQPNYNIGDLLETCCNLPPLGNSLTTLARKASKTKQEMVRSMRRLFQSELLSSKQKGDYVFIDGLGRLPAKYHDSLQETRRKIFELVKKCLENDELFSSSRVEIAQPFTSLLENLLQFCAILGPEKEVHETTHTSRRETSNLRVDKTISRIQQISFARKKTDVQAQPIFEQTSLHHCLGPDTCGQRLLNSTLIKSKTLSDSHLRTSRETQEFLVMSLPHRLSVHTGMKKEGKSHFGIMELTWRAGTPIPSSESEECQKERASGLSELSGKPIELKEHHWLKEPKQRSKFKIPKSKSVPPLSHRKVKPFAEKQLTLFQALNSLNSKDSLAGLVEYINNKNIIKKQFLGENGNLCGSFTGVPQPPQTATPLSVLASPALRMKNNVSMSSVKSGESSGRRSTFHDQAHDLTRESLVRNLDEFHHPPVWGFGGRPRRL